MKLLLTVIMLSLGPVGCAALPENLMQTPSYAIDPPKGSVAGQYFAAEILAHRGQSGHVLVPDGQEAFMVRNAMAGMAEKSLDIQYYLWETDTTGLLLIQQLVEAADRGVRVRLLLDDIHTEGQDFAIASLDVHPRIEIRLFNPFASRAIRAVDYLTDLSRINHRMHNKVFLMDNTVSVLGGRNISDHYFGMNEDSNFRDLDIISVGPSVQRVSEAFDEYWNSRHAVPIKALVDENTNYSDLAEIRDIVSEQVAKLARKLPYKPRETREQMQARFDDIQSRLVWAPTRVLHDPVEKVNGARSVFAEIGVQLLPTLEKEFLIESSYLIPGNRGTAQLISLAERGVVVKALTNSLSSNDVIAAHAGYARYRKKLLDGGVQLYELRSDADLRRDLSVFGSKSHASLHSKTMVFDRKSVFIGSVNVDPRSRMLNTEIGLYITSPILAEQVAAQMEDAIAPQNSYKVSLDEDNDLVWISSQDGEVVTNSHEPHTSLLTRIMSKLVRILPIEKHL